MKLALLDDYHGVALQMADWDRLPGRVAIAKEPPPRRRRALHRQCAVLSAPETRPADQ